MTFLQITAGSPADGSLQRGDIILDIDQRPTHSMLHSEALDLVQRAGGQITFLVQRFDCISLVVNDINSLFSYACLFYLED